MLDTKVAKQAVSDHLVSRAQSDEQTERLVGILCDEIEKLRTERDQLRSRLEVAEMVCEAVEKHFGPGYASDNWNIRNSTRAALAAWRSSYETKEQPKEG